VTKHAHCAFHFNSTDEGGEVAILYGRIAREDDMGTMVTNSAYYAKYKGPLEELAADRKTTPEAIAAEYSVPLVMAIEDSTGW
jgi:hypothetical protein